MQIAKISLVAALALSPLPLTLVSAAPAVAECTSAADISLCSEASAEVASLPYYPYPCDLDWYCSDGSLSLLNGPEPGGLNANRSGGPDRGGDYTQD